MPQLPASHDCSSEVVPISSIQVQLDSQLIPPGAEDASFQIVKRKRGRPQKLAVDHPVGGTSSQKSSSSMLQSFSP